MTEALDERSSGRGARLQPREIIAGRFTIVRFIARGGMGEVYEAQDLVLHTRIALKTILPGFAEDPISLNRFHREVLLARRISHPNVCRIYELYSTQTPAGEPLHFLTMEFLEGKTLAERLRGGPMRTAELWPILRQVSAALDAAHAEGVVHRDFKTSNVMLVARGGEGTRGGEERAVVTDFGIARSLWAEPGAAEKVTGVGLLGTPEYMAPEQVTGGEVGPPADIYALGVVLYEALTGRTPFAGATPLECALRRVNERPTAPRDLLPRLEGEWNRAILKCLEREPARRFPTAGDLVRFLDQPGASRRHRLLASAAAIAVILAFGSAGAAWRLGLFGPRHGEHWLQSEVIPELHRLADSDQLLAAQLLAMKADAELPGNPSLRRVWRSFATEATIQSEPSGARVSIRDYRGTHPVWHRLGTTPLTIPFPLDYFRARLELEGHWTAELAANAWTFAQPIPLDRQDAHGEGLLHVPGGRFGPGNLRDNALQLGDFLIDKYEVTNRRFKAFVDAGGYQRREFWRDPFVRNGHTLTWDQAVSLFRDRTGRPGPSSWELSNYPPGQDGHPVGGLSWYEAAAFAAFEGRDLPTVYHWRRAAGFYAAGHIISGSNFAGKGPAPVGQYQGLSIWGALDMAGNVREWCFNEGAGNLVGRVIAGGGWDEPSYVFLNDRFVQSPWDRSPTNGLRLVTYLTTEPNLERAREPVVRAVRDYSKEKPAGDAEFGVYRRMYDYDPRPLHEVIEARETGTDWVRERVTFDAAYPGARVVAYLFLPRASPPPYQTIVYFPGASATALKSVDDDSRVPEFLLRSGRALILPVYRGTYERRKESDAKPWAPEKTVSYREAVIHWTQDLRRSIDYLETREDIDRRHLGYFGFSWGGRFGGLIPAVEPRLRASVLHVAGLRPEPSLPEVDPFNFLPRVKIPTLILNGRYDPSFGVESVQAMFRGLGTPPGLKRLVTYETGHFVPRDQVIKETVDWYDRHLGPVNTLGPASGSSPASSPARGR